MNNYNPNIHHRHSIRLKGYDYSQAGLYFITICVQDRKCLFGKIENDEMVMNDAGKIADDCWLEIQNHFPDAVLHEHIVMPNHVHGIVELIKTGSPTIESPNISPRNEFQKIIPHSIGSIIRGYKIGVTKWFRNNTIGGVMAVRAENFQPFQPLHPRSIWQRNYYEHIIRDEKSYKRISEYIINNPKNWKEDNFLNE